jgi:imidazolonepropionase-like amidohydrolase
MPRLILSGAHVLNAAGEEFIAGAHVITEGDRIVAIAQGEPDIGTNDEVHELDGAYVIPGLIDAHFHLVSRSAHEVDDALIAGSMIEGVVTAAAVLAAGVTTVRDCGCRHLGIHELRKAMGGLIPGPRAYVAGRNPTGPLAPRHWRNVTASGTAAMRAAVMTELDAGADFIKLVVAHAEQPTDWSQVTTFLSEDELRAAVQTAHERGARVGAHIEGFEVAAAAVRAGIDVLDHAPLLSEETVEQMAALGTAYVPTVWGFSDDSGIDLDRLDAADAEAIGRWRAEHKASVRRALAAGVLVAAGSDAAGSLPAGTVLHDELDALADCGLTGSALLATATRNAAAVIGRQEKLGVIEVGALADLVVLGADPLMDIAALRTPELVVSRGRVLNSSWAPQPELLAAAVTERWVDE